MKKAITNILIVSTLSLSLPACIFVAGAAAGAAAVAIVYDHRTISSSLHDASLGNRIAEKIKFVPELHYESHIEVTVFNRVVLLTGETPNPYLRAQAEEIAKSFREATRVYNQITIQGPTSTLTRTSDSWITTKIKGELLTAENLSSSSIKVITENGVVFLMGTVTRQQAEMAVDISRQVAGVQKVVKIFQYTN